MNDDLARAHADAIAATLGPTGRLLGMSKTGYRNAHPGHAVVFNANVCLPDGKIWYGDIDLTTDEHLLADLAVRTEQIVHILYEQGGRFRNEDRPQLDEAVYSITPTGHTRLDHTRLERRLDGQVYERPYERPPQWRRPSRPRLWRIWCVHLSNERISGKLGERRSHRVYIGRRGLGHRSPLLVVGGHSWAHQARGGWIEVTWYPGAHRAWAPSVSRRLKWHGRRVRPFANLRFTPGVSHELQVGVVVGPEDPLWG
jgi:hypothetical protein